MWKLVFVGFLLTHITVVLSAQVSSVYSRGTETMDSAEDDSKSIEIPVRNRPRSPSKGFSIFKQVDEPIFNFINKLVNTSYLSSRMALRRIKTQSEKRKEIENQIEEFLENLPTFPIPILDDMPHL